MVRKLHWVINLLIKVGIIYVLFSVILACITRNPRCLLLAVASSVLCLGGCAALLCYISVHNRRRARLLAEGTRIYADVYSVELDSKNFLNGQHPMVICCEARNPADGRLYVFRSESIWDYDIDLSVKAVGVDRVPVYVDPNHCNRYAVDLSEIFPEIP